MHNDIKQVVILDREHNSVDMEIDYKNKDSIVDCDADNLQYLPIGSKFYTLSDSSINRYYINEDGEPTVQVSSCYRPITYEITPSENEKVYSRVLSFDDKSITAELFFENYESKRIFKKLFRDILEEKGLLSVNQEFYIVTKKTENGVNVEIEPIKEICDKEVSELYKTLGTNING